MYLHQLSLENGQTVKCFSVRPTALINFLSPTHGLAFSSYNKRARTEAMKDMESE